jgi:hypothetical protein
LLLVKFEVVPSPQATVPEKSLAVAPGLASLNVSFNIAAVTPSTPSPTSVPNGVSAASAIVALSVAFPVRLLVSVTATPIVRAPSSA